MINTKDTKVCLGVLDHKFDIKKWIKKHHILLEIIKSSSNFSVEREHVQKKTFTKWVNSHLSRINCRVSDLYTDLRDGKLLIKLLEILSGERLVSSGATIIIFRADYDISSPVWMFFGTMSAYSLPLASALCSCVLVLRLCVPHVLRFRKVQWSFDELLLRKSLGKITFYDYLI